MSENNISWNLSELFPSVDHPDISKAIDTYRKKSDQFEEEYKGKIKSPEFSAQNLLDLFEKQELFIADIYELQVYSSLSFSANMTLPETQTLYNQVMEFNAKIQKKLAFLTIEIGNFISNNRQIIDNPLLKNYKHYLEKIARSHPHILSEKEEQIIIEKDRYGVTGWSLLQSKWLNTRTFSVKVEGNLKKLSYGEANGLLIHKDRWTRISANKVIYGLLGQDDEIFSSALRNICGDWVNVTKRRNFDSPMHQSLIDNDIDQKTINNLMVAIENHISLYRRYLGIKAKLLNIPKLGCSDIVAPLLNAPDIRYDWETAKELTLQAYNSFDDQFKEITSDMFLRNHIDASPRFGKRNGAFCSSWYKGKSAFILQTFTNSLKDIYTLVHEMGHAIHANLSSQNQTLFNTDISMVAAETASIFGELLLTDLLLKKSDSKEEKMTILTRVLDGAGMAVFQVSARVWFEQSLYDMIEQGKFLDGNTISKLWCAGRDKIYGEFVDWFEEMDAEWMMKPHYYRPNFRFYNYPYVFAQLFVYALYQTYKQNNQEFIPKFKNLLNVGGSLSPKDLGNIMGLDISDPDFWSLGMKQYENFVNELEELTPD